MLNPREMVDLYAQDIDVGTIESYRCPYCNAPERSLSVGRVSVDHYWWKCWRASCNERGATAKFIFAPQYPMTRAPFTPRPLPEDRRLSVYHDQMWRNKFKRAGYALDHESAAVIGLYGDMDVADRVYWDCKAFDGTHLGYQQRTDTGGTKHVTTWREAPGAFYYQFAHPQATKAYWVLVEDPFSAALVGMDGGAAIALLGTNLTDLLLEELSWTSGFIVALDPGAEESALDILAKLRGSGRSAQWMPLRNDLKDMGKEKRRNLLKYYGAIHPNG